MTATIEKEKCTGCGECVESCPIEAITLAEDKACVDSDTCVDCGACVDTCPVTAIEL